MYCVHTEEANLRLARAPALPVRDHGRHARLFHLGTDIYLRDKTPDE